jgi:hypothetical protein
MEINIFVASILPWFETKIMFKPIIKTGLAGLGTGLSSCLDNP